MTIISGIVKLTKAQTKNNITGTISENEDGTFRSYNLTGNLIELNNFVTRDGVDLSDQLVNIECPTTLLIFNKSQGEAVVSKCAEIFEKRMSQNDLNPAVDIHFECKTVRPRETNILVVNIKAMRVDADTQIADHSESVLETIEKLKANSVKANQQTDEVTNPQKNMQTNIARKSANILNGVKNFVKKEF